MCYYILVVRTFGPFECEQKVSPTAKHANKHTARAHVCLFVYHVQPKIQIMASYIREYHVLYRLVSTLYAVAFAAYLRTLVPCAAHKLIRRICRHKQASQPLTRNSAKWCAHALAKKVQSWGVIDVRRFHSQTCVCVCKCVPHAITSIVCRVASFACNDITHFWRARNTHMIFRTVTLRRARTAGLVMPCGRISSKDACSISPSRRLCQPATAHSIRETTHESYTAYLNTHTNTLTASAF